MAQNIIQQTAVAYAQKLGLAVFPLAPKSKIPATKHGLKDASKSADAIKQWWDRQQDCNLAIATGAASGVWVLDADGEDGKKDIENLIAKHGALPQTPVQKTANGFHYFFKMPEDVVIRNTSKLIRHEPRITEDGRKKIEGIEVRGEGGYVVVAPSIHPDTGKSYEWLVKPSQVPFAEAPEWLIKLVTAERDTGGKAEYRPQGTLPTASRGVVSRRWAEQHINAIIASLMDSIEGTRNNALNIAALKVGHCVPAFIGEMEAVNRLQQAALAIGLPHNEAVATITSGLRAGMKEPLREASEEEIASYKAAREAEKAVKPSAGCAQEDYDPDTGEIISEYAASEAVAIPELPNPLELDGLLGETVRWICSTSTMEQPQLALLNVIAFAGAVFGRRYATTENTRTNIYTVGIAPSGQGKDHSRQLIPRLATAAGLEHYIGANNVISGAGLAKSMIEQASQVMHIDEFGLFLQTLSDPKAAGYKKEITAMMLTFYSQSRGIYNHGKYANNDAAPIVIKYPNLCVYGVTTLETYLGAFRKDTIRSGELGRFVVLQGINWPTIKRNKESCVSLPERLIAEWSRFSPAPLGSDMDNKGDSEPEIIKVVYGDGVEDHIFTLRQIAQNRQREGAATGALWARWVENAIKVAMILSIARDNYRPVINMDDLTYGALIAEISIASQVKIAEDNMAENETEANKLAVLKVIRDAMPEGVSKSALTRQLRKLKARELDDILQSLIDEGTIRFDSVTTKTNKKHVYRLV